MTGRPLLGLILALFVEASHWTRLRWDFDEEAFGRAWQLTTVSVAIAAVLIWLDGNRYNALPNLLSWLPPLLMPMQFIQSYGMRPSLPLSSFSFLARRRHARSRRLGLIEETTVFNFGNVLFAACMVAAAIGEREETWIFLPAVVLLTGWSLLGSRNSIPRSLAPVLAVVALCGFGGRIGIEYFEQWLGHSGGTYRSRFDPNYSGTMIGTPGEVRQSPEIIWRITPAAGSPPPALLRTGSFNTFIGANWQNQRVAANDFNDLDTRLEGDTAHWLLDRSGENQETPAAADVSAAGLPAYRIRGTATEETPLPLPGDVLRLSGFDLDDSMERNSFGTVRIHPKNPVIDGSVIWRGNTNPELPPFAKEDFRIPDADVSALDDAIREMDLRPEEDITITLAKLRTWFHSEFRYSRYLRIRHGPDIGGKPGPTALAKFLGKVREGHCEYFATSATLILRRLGIPARYAVGYAVIERERKRPGFAIRGTHGHAWSRVWDASTGRWLDFDATPPDWSATATPGMTAIQRFNDAVKRVREDFFVWRNQPGNQLAVLVLASAIGLAASVHVARRLWRSRRTLAERDASYHAAPPLIRTPLHDLEKRATRLLGRRPPGKPFAQWLAPLADRIGDPAPFDEAIALHQRLRFDPAGISGQAAHRLAELTRLLARELRGHSRPLRGTSPD
jgi:protein-glutamine gamma-glutamyltransferase